MKPKLDEVMSKLNTTDDIVFTKEDIKDIAERVGELARESFLSYFDAKQDKIHEDKGKVRPAKTHKLKLDREAIKRKNSTKKGRKAFNKLAEEFAASFYREG